MPEGRAGQQAAWVLGQMERPTGDPVIEAPARFTADFLADIPPEELVELLDRLRAVAPWTPVEARGTDAAVVVVATSRDQDVEMELAVDAEGLIDGLYFSEPG